MAIRSRTRQANKKALEETALITGTTKAEVYDIVNHYSKFAAEMIKAGLYEGLSFPHFGKILPKVKQIHSSMEWKGKTKAEPNIYTKQEENNG